MVVLARSVSRRECGRDMACRDCKEMEEKRTRIFGKFLCARCRKLHVAIPEQDA